MNSSNEVERLLTEIRDTQQEMVERQRRWSNALKWIIWFGLVVVVMSVVVSVFILLSGSAGPKVYELCEKTTNPRPLNGCRFN